MKSRRTEVETRVSVVVPVYNARRFLEEALRSVLGQSVAEFEVIVVDDGSTDGSAAIAEEIAASDPRISVHREEHGGAARARDRGIALARSPYLAFLDADDFWFPNMLERHLEQFASRNNLAVVGSRMDYVGVSGRRLGITGQNPTEVDLEQVRRGELLPFVLSSVLCRTAKVREVGGFDDLFPGRALSEDLHFLAKLAAVGEMICLRQPSGAYRIHETSASGAKHAEILVSAEYVRRVLENPSLPERMDWDAFRAQYKPSRSERREQAARASYRAGATALLNRRWGRAVRELGRAVALRPRYTVKRAWRQVARR